MRTMSRKPIGYVLPFLIVLNISACRASQEREWQLYDTSIVFESANVLDVEFSPSGKQLGITTSEGIHLYEFDALKESWSHQTTSDTLSFSPDGTLMAISTDAHEVVVLHVDTGEVSETLTLAEQDVYAVHNIGFSPDGKLLAATIDRSTATSMVMIWKAESGERVLTLQPEEPLNVPESVYGPLMSMAFSPNRALLATGWFGSLVILWNIETGQRIQDLQNLEMAFGSVDGLDWHPNGSLLASGHRGGTVAIWNPDTGNLLHTFVTGDDYAYRVKWSHSGDFLAVGTSSGRVIILDKDGTLLDILETHKQFVNTVAWSPDDDYLVAGDAAGQIYIWRVIK